ncbi:hypothetical protein [Flavobacterium selenitireducens]|uniref:hypothetical protein n=1 Tax=Flavobacterium selenitireducens TaxID=2722704 RepID=UPI00168C0A26|nr:hypothetical protein [Flavobacterium selenitireducens]MBD3581588.1 hypothetical protein [Flavobacterium selenitireducens]
MVETLKKYRFQEYLLIGSALILLLKSYETTFLFWAMAAVLSLRFRYSLTMLKIMGAYGAILLIAAVSSFFYDHRIYDIFRDLAYLLKPILGLMIGYNCAKVMGKKVLNVILSAGFLLAVIHLLTLLFYFVVDGIRDMNMLRLYGGYFDDLQIYVLIFVIFRKELGIEISQKKAILMLTVVGISTVFYLARTNIIQFFILFFAIKGYLRPTPRAIRSLLLISAGVLLAYGAIYIYNPKRMGSGLDAFLYKVKIAPVEPFKTKINEEDWKDWNDNYRSFENIITVRQVSSEGWTAIVFGKGMGSTIDLGRELWTNDLEFIRHIPTLHNSYMTVFLKSGLVGVLLLLFSIYQIQRQPRSSDPRIRVYNYLLTGSAIYLILSNWVFMGLYLKLDNKSMVIGALLAYRELLLRERNTNRTYPETNHAE